METDELIATLSADTTPPARPAMARRLALGLVLVLAALPLIWGLRSGFPMALMGGLVWLKLALPLALIVMAGLMLRRAPEDAPLPLWPLALPAVLAGGLWLRDVLAGGDVWGTSLGVCLISIPLLALPMGAALFAALRHRVEPDPARAGMVAGLLAGAMATLVYALHCDEDAPAFFLLWYGAGIAISACAGRFAGRRLLGV